MSCYWGGEGGEMWGGVGWWGHHLGPSNCRIVTANMFSHSARRAFKTSQLPSNKCLVQGKHFLSANPWCCRIPKLRQNGLENRVPSDCIPWLNIRGALEQSIIVSVEYICLSLTQNPKLPIYEIANILKTTWSTDDFKNSGRFTGRGI